MIRTQAGSKAFGVEEGHAPYRLRQARYYELGIDCANWAKNHYVQTGHNLRLLDIGTFDGVLRKYTEIHPGADHIDYSAVDLFPHGQEFVYKHESWSLYHENLEFGMSSLDSNSYDVIVCEQVLEHLHCPERAISEMYRVVKPGGRLVIGVPIFPPGLDLVRKHVIPVTDEIFCVKKVRGHVQGWSQGSFLRLLRQVCPELEIIDKRGFRIVSGGVLARLEYFKWWWKINRKIGSMVPMYCIEIQVTTRKPDSCIKTTRPAA